MSSNVPRYLVVFAIVFLSSSAEISELTKKALNNNFMEINKKFDFISDRVDKLEGNSPLGPHFVSDWNEMKVNLKQIMLSIEALNQKTDKLHKKTEEIPKMKELLLELIETKMNKRETTNDVVNEMTSHCTSFCEAKVQTWANESNSRFKGELERMDFTLNNNNSPFNTSDPCHPNPCSNGGECERNRYQCTNCPFLTSGRHCENLNCNKANKCFLYHSSMYVVFEENVDWATAYNVCRKVGMRLAQLKDRDTSEAVIGQLKIMYAPSRLLHFWIGLKTNGSEWLWLDGTPLGAYTGGVVNFKSKPGERWGIIYLHGGSITWDPRFPTDINRYIDYPLCEKRIYTRY